MFDISKIFKIIDKNKMKKKLKINYIYINLFQFKII